MSGRGGRQDARGRSMLPGRLRTAGTELVVVGLVATLIAFAWVSAARADGPAADEFPAPSPSTVPAPSAYNTTPSSCLTATSDFCEVDAPSDSLPLADPSSPERYLNSAYWPAEKRPDIEMYAIQQYGYAYQNCSDPRTWNHYCFLVDAEAAGYPVTHTPAVGDLWLARCDDIIFAGSGTPSCPLGDIYYVGYVEQVAGDGSFVVTEGGTGADDSGLEWDRFSGAMDAQSSFIGFFPTGQAPTIEVQVEVDSSAGGSGTVSDASGQTCSTAGSSTDCVFDEPGGAPITFTETTQSGSAFFAWYGACSGTGPCSPAFDGDNRWLYAYFYGTGGGGGTTGGGPTGGGGTGGSGSAPTAAPTRGTSPGPRPRLSRVSAAHGTIHARIGATHATCALARWTRHRWRLLRTARCSASVTYRRLKPGRYRLTVRSGRLSATRVVILRRRR